MAWYYGKFSCGCDGRTNIIGPTRDRERKANWEFSKPCDDCRVIQRKKEIEEENKASMEEAEEMELPLLNGSEKQVAWSTTIRQDFIKEADEIMSKFFIRVEEDRDKLDEEKLVNVEKQISDFNITKDYLLEHKTKASFWIDHRSEDAARMLTETFVKEALEQHNNYEWIEMHEIRKKEIKIESTVIPENKKIDGIVEITVREDAVRASFERNEEFRLLVRGLGYRWTGELWSKKIKETTGSPEDRAAELGNKLLNAGFPIMIVDTEIRENAINGNFEPECTRWILSRVDSDSLAIYWTGKNQDLYDKARSLPGSKWDNPYVVVKVENFVAIEEFVEFNGFKFTKTARRKIEEYKEVLEKARKITPAEVDDPIIEDGLERILESSDDILDDLKD